ncbi:MAG TPA: carboxypeptidase regulatory-like domain-containing protein [Terriglobales bacterium]
MKFSLKVIACTALAWSTFASASNLTGTVTNGTTGKPSAGDDVVLIKFGQGMEEASRTKTDANGKFTLTVPDDGGPHLVRDIHQGVTYNQMATPGTSSVDLQVFDVAKKVPGVTVNADVIRIQAEGNQLEGVRFFAVDNLSTPPHTQMNDANFEFYLPDGAEVDEGQAQTQGGQPVNSAPVPQAVKNRYAFMFPLRPGTTQFQVVFHMPYTGQLKIDPKSLYPAEHLMVMLPATMKFTPAQGATYQALKDPHQADASVQVASKTKPGQTFAFTVSGTGTINDTQQGADQGQAQNGQTTSGGAASAADNRPGGGLGPPIDAPDPLQKDWPYILGGFAVLLVGGAVFTMKRPRTAAPAGYAPEDFAETAATSPVSLPSAASQSHASSHSSRLLDALKEELFQLEVDRNQGKMTQAEYDQAKSALDQTLNRALKRQAEQK